MWKEKCSPQNEQKIPNLPKTIFILEAYGINHLLEWQCWNTISQWENTKKRVLFYCSHEITKLKIYRNVSGNYKAEYRWFGFVLTDSLVFKSLNFNSLGLIHCFQNSNTHWSSQSQLWSLGITCIHWRVFYPEQSNKYPFSSQQWQSSSKFLYLG